jgi:hypothetical protein
MRLRPIPRPRAPLEATRSGLGSLTATYGIHWAHKLASTLEHYNGQLQLHGLLAHGGHHLHPIEGFWRAIKDAIDTGRCLRDLPLLYKHTRQVLMAHQERRIYGLRWSHVSPHTSQDLLYSVGPHSFLIGTPTGEPCGFGRTDRASPSICPALPHNGSVRPSLRELGLKRARQAAAHLPGPAGAVGASCLSLSISVTAIGGPHKETLATTGTLLRWQQLTNRSFAF